MEKNITRNNFKSDHAICFCQVTYDHHFDRNYSFFRSHKKSNKNGGRIQLLPNFPNYRKERDRNKISLLIQFLKFSALEAGPCENVTFKICQNVHDGKVCDNVRFRKVSGYT